MTVMMGLLLWLDGCAAGGAVRLEAPRPVGEELVWPAPPDQARIRHVRSFASTEDLGFRRSIVGRVLDFVRGRDRTQRLQHPYGIAVTVDERIYVVDSAAKGVHEYDLPRGRYRFLDGDGFGNPIGVAVDRRGRILVSDSEAGAIVVLDEGGDEVDRITSGLQRPTGIAIHPTTEDLYVVDTEAHSVVVFDRDGNRTASFGRRGAGLGELNYPTLIAIGPDGQVYVSDSLNFRIQVFTEGGVPVRTFGGLGDAVGEFARPKGLGVDADGRVFVVEGLYDVVNVFDAQGRLLLTFGAAGRADGAFWLATGLAIDERGRVFISDSYNGRVQVFQVLETATP
jgi:DNA-binding beta-propeller fold protein YncE